MMSIQNVALYRLYAVKGTTFGKFLFEPENRPTKNLMTYMHDAGGVTERKKARRGLNIDRIE